MLAMEITRLIERCRQGDADALGELYKAYAQQMRGVCRRYISDEQTVEDVLHDAFVIIFTSFDRLRDARRAEAWMASITRNVARKCMEQQTAVTMVPIEEAAMVSQPTEQADVRGVPLSEVVRMIDRLPEGYGQVFRLSVFEGMSHKEIADMLGIEPHSSSSQLARAKKMLRKMMQHYWVAMLLLLFIPVTLFLLRKGDNAVTNDEKPVAAKQEKSESEHQPSLKESARKPANEPVMVPLPVRHTTLAADTMQRAVAQTVDTIKLDTIINTMAQEQMIPDSTVTDTTKIIRKMELPHYDTAQLLPDQPAKSTDSEKKWSLELAYAGQFDEQNHYNQPYIYKPYIDPAIQHSPSQGGQPGYVVPSSIDNWADYAVYLANRPDAVSEKTRSAIMNIALSNANRPGDDKMLRTSHHRMPVTWSLALRYRLSRSLGLETGLSYSRLASDFEMGAEGYTIREQQTIHYLGIPVKGTYTIYGKKLWNFYGSLGLTTEIPVSPSFYTDYYVNGVLESSDQTAIRVPWQFSTTFGLGLQLHLTPHVGFFVEPSLQYFIPTHSDIETYRTEHPFMFSLPLGIRFTW